MSKARYSIYINYSIEREPDKIYSSENWSNIYKKWILMNKREIDYRTRERYGIVCNL